MARRDEEGFCYIVDRKSDGLISGGLNVYPKEIEQAAVAVPGLMEGAAAGVSDFELGQAIHYFYVAEESGRQALACSIIWSTRLRPLMRAQPKVYAAPKCHGYTAINR